MSRLIGFKADAETANAIDLDRMRLGRELGLADGLTISQYFRHLVALRTSAESASDLGWAEGYKAAYADAMRKIAAALNDVD